jgi:hypothetical protein
VGAQDEAESTSPTLMSRLALSVANNVVAAALAESLAKPLPWAVGFFFGNLELSMELWTVIAGLSGFDE